MMSAQPTLVLVDERPADGYDGGVEHEVGVFQAACAARGVPVVREPMERVGRALRAISPGPALVFTQQEGPLSASYARSAAEWLSCGATVVEKNVFALPSRWRPRHPRYVMALMSQDGSHRLRLRSLLGGASRPGGWLHLKNPCDPAAAAAARDGDVDLHFLRVGRPDIRKWTTFETAFVRSAAQAHPDLTFRLTLVGVPGELARPALPSNVDLVVLPYLRREALEPHYARAHVYLHHSRIGETFGNTLAEAALRGLRIVLGCDPQWDCAPLEFVPPGSAVGRPGHLCRSAPDLVRRLVTAAPPVPPPIPDGPAQLALLLALAGEPAGALLPEPRLRDSLRYVLGLGAQIHGSTLGDCVAAAAIEVLRGHRRMRRSR